MNNIGSVCALQLDLDLHTGGQLQGHQGLHGLGGGLADVDEALVGAALKLLAAVLVLVDGPQNGDDFLLGGQRNGAGDLSAGALGSLDDLLCALVNDLVIVGSPYSRFSASLK